uniref:Aldehyde oxidase 5 n=1 Tax=Hucho hucho TaxID=62062 RepID=A0A4W5P4Z6_9TELE
MRMGKKHACGSLCFQGDRLKLISPVDLTNLLELKTEYPEAPVVVSNTTIGTNLLFLKGVHHPLIIYAGRVSDLRTVTWGKDGVSVGAVCTLSSLKEEMERAVREMEAERTRGYQALPQTLQCLAGKQIRNMAVNPITWEFVSAFRQAQRREFAFSIVNAGMKVVFKEGSNIVESLNIYYGGVGPTLVKVGRTCQKLVGRSWGEELLADACWLLEEEVELSDSAHRGKVEYQKTLTTSFFFKFYMQVLQELRERQFQQATGEAQYYDDMPPVQGELLVFKVTSTRAHIKIIREQQDLLPVFFTIEEAIQHQSFFNPKRKLGRGDVDKAFETVDQILEDEVYLRGQEHFYMETQGLIAMPKRENGELELFVASQHAAYTQESLWASITCHVRRLGGAFGGKVMKIASLSAITATAAVKTGRAVRCVLECGDDMLITSGRHPFLGKYKLFNGEGGPWMNHHLYIMEKALLHMDNGYRIPNLRGCGLVCKTYLPSYMPSLNIKSITMAFRGFGGQGLMVMESVLHEAAVKCGLPPQEVREINMYREEECYTHHKQLFSPRDMLRCWDECLDKAGYHHRLQAIQQFDTYNRWKKRGISAVPMKFGVGFSKGFYNQGAALVNIYKDGSVLVTHGGTEMGQGINTKALQISGCILKVPMSSNHIKETCMGNVPSAAPSAASFGTDAVGMAVKDACEKLMRRLKPVMENHPKYTWQQWVINKHPPDYNKLNTMMFCVNLHNGIAYNKLCSFPQIVEANCQKTKLTWCYIFQIEGVFVQGIGLYTIEELQFSPEGVLMTRGPFQYNIPALWDVHLLANAQNPHVIYMSKGIGDPLVFLASTIFFAIKEAVAAARRERGLGDSFPLSSPDTAERIRMACEDQFTKMAPSPKNGTFKPWSINI